jgi:predicted transcriptional regulator
MKSELSNIDLIVDQEAVRKELRELMEEKRVGTIQATYYIQLSQTSLYNFLSGKNLSSQAIIKLLNGMDKLKEADL